MNALTRVAITMTSLELVDFINQQRKEGEPELLHKNFLAKVPDVLGGTSANFSADLPDAYGRPRRGYRFPKREACLMAMSYSYELQAKVFDRMTELEAKQSPAFAIPKSMSEALRLAADLSEQNERLAIERDTAVRTKAEIGSRREATAMATAAAKAKEVARLKHELGRNQQHATVIAVEKATDRKFAKNAYVALRRVTKEYGLTAVEVVDARYGTVKAWPAVAWREAFGVDLDDLFPGAEAA